MIKTQSPVPASWCSEKGPGKPLQSKLTQVTAGGRQPKIHCNLSADHYALLLSSLGFFYVLGEGKVRQINPVTSGMP